jgi:hypothetical protein
MKQILSTLLIFCGSVAYSQIDSISPEKLNIDIGKLRSQKSSYLIWRQNIKTGAVSTISIWNRSISFEKWRDRDVVVIEQMRYCNDTANDKYVFTVCDKRSFKPLYNYSKRVKTGIEAFNYSDERIYGADTLLSNTKKDFSIATTSPSFCFEVDLETLSLLPLKYVGQKMAVNFYHPGGGAPPAYYSVEVIGSENLSVSGGNEIDCWVVKLIYDNSSYDLDWIAKKTGEFIKLEGHSSSDEIFNKMKVLAPLETKN